MLRGHTAGMRGGVGGGGLAEVGEVRQLAGGVRRGGGGVPLPQHALQPLPERVVLVVPQVAMEALQPGFCLKFWGGGVFFARHWKNATSKTPGGS